MTAPTRRTATALRKLGASAVIAVVVICVGVVADVRADPASDALAKLNELSRQADQMNESVLAARVRVEESLSARTTAEQRNAADLANVATANTDMNVYQGAVDRVAASAYMGGPGGELTGFLTATSPQQFIDDVAVKRVIATDMATMVTRYREAHQKLATAEAASATSAQQARYAAEQAAMVTAELQARQSRLSAQIAAVKAQYVALTPEQRLTLAAPQQPSREPPTQPPAVLADGQDPTVAGVPPSDQPAPGWAPDSGNPAVVQAAMSKLGSPYSWGAAGPNAFDCSGLIMWAFQQTGKSLPHSSQALANGGAPVPFSEMQPGDVVTFYPDISHAGIYIGDGMMVHASTFGVPVRVASVTSAPFYNARRY